MSGATLPAESATVPRRDAASIPLRIGSRGSALALVQANWVAERLRKRGTAAEIVIITTSGDVRAADTAWGEGAFVTAIEAALLEGSVDIAVHSAKDVPTDEDERLAIAAWTLREDPRDALVCRVRGMSLATLPQGARVGTDSPRRTAFLRACRPDLRMHPLSGNVDSRLRKLDEGESDALVLAVAGLTRLGRLDRIDEILPLDVVVPAPGQGALALQTRASDERAATALAPLDDHAARICVQAERAFLAATGGGCRSPIGALGELRGDELTLHVAAERDVAPGVLRMTDTAPAANWRHLAESLAARVVSGRSRARVVVTRPPEAAAPLARALAMAGVETLVVPTIEILPEEGGDLDAAVSAAASTGAWLVATSPNGVRACLSSFDRAALNPAALRWGVVGQASAALLRDRGAYVFLPSRPLGATLAAELPIEPGDDVLVVRGDIADPSVGAVLRARHAAAIDVVAYRTREAPPLSRAPLNEAFLQPIDAITFASGSAVRGALLLADERTRDALVRTPAVCIGPRTAQVALTAGFTQVCEADDPQIEALVRSISSVLPAVPPRRAGAAPGDFR
ncbi:MAG: hydroxymethylbilane synthase [Chloroflexota bacterium]|nr:hydroxymethylbilane synthase [Chloroflexota bacterium]